MSLYKTRPINKKDETNPYVKKQSTEKRDSDSANQFHIDYNNILIINLQFQNH